jgi:hypothetical protein
VRRTRRAAPERAAGQAKREEPPVRRTRRDKARRSLHVSPEVAQAPLTDG